MKYVVFISRVLFGLPILVFGVMGLLVVLPDPHAAWENQEDFSPAATKLMLAMWDSGFLMPSVCLAHLVAGVLVIVNRFAALALAVHLPVTLQMVLFHLFLDPATGGIAYVLVALNVFLIGVYRESYRGLLEARSK